jgi:hypothetical protein
MKELIIAILLAVIILFFAPYVGVFFVYVILFGLFATIGIMTVRLTIQGVKILRRNIKQAE